MSVIRIQGSIPWNACRDPTTEIWVAVCEPLKLTVQGETWAVLMGSISDTLNIVFHDLFRTGDFERFLRTHGWKMLNDSPVKANRLRFDVPFDVKRRSLNYVHNTEAALCK